MVVRLAMEWLSIVVDFQADDYSESSREELSSLGKHNREKLQGNHHI